MMDYSELASLKTVNNDDAASNSGILFFISIQLQYAGRASSRNCYSVQRLLQNEQRGPTVSPAITDGDGMCVCVCMQSKCISQVYFYHHTFALA
jgi:hypothetical protein